MCGTLATFERDRVSISESFRCPGCRGVLRYQVQARAILRAFSRLGARCVAELVEEPEFRALRILEPGTRGPLRRFLRPLDGYVQTYYDPTGTETHPASMRNEDLMALSFAPASFDLVITSDVLEHVRHPERAFREILRILRPGGWHIFTIPGRWPLPSTTVARVDVSGGEDLPVLPAVYHNGEHLVYNDFGLDLFEHLDTVGFVTEPLLFASSSATTSMQAAFASRRPAAQGAVPKDATVGAGTDASPSPASPKRSVPRLRRRPRAPR